MASNYPTGLDAFATGTLTGIVSGSDHGNKGDALNKIEAELGISPSSGQATVAARLGSLAVNVLDYAADPTGVADSTTPFTNALAALPAYSSGVGGGTVYVPPGTYKITSALTLSSGQRIVGVGKRASYLRGDYNGNIVTSATNGGADPLSLFVGIENLFVNNVNAGASARSIKLNQISHLVLRECTFQGIAAGSYNAHLNACILSEIDHCVFGGAAGADHCLVIDNNSHGCTLLHCTFTDSKAGLRITTCTAPTLLNPHCENLAGGAGSYNSCIALSQIFGGSIEGGHFEGCVNAGITFYGTAGVSRGVSIKDTYMTNIFSPCIDLNAAEKCEVGPNYFVPGAISPDQHGVYNQGTSHYTNRISPAQYKASGAGLAINAAAPTTVASTAALTLPDEPSVVQVSGSTTITSIVASTAGRAVTLKFTGTCKLQDGSNLKLDSDYNAVADDTITLSCDGTNWNELSRSVQSRGLKVPVRTASVANVTISAPGATIDGVTMAAGERMLLKDQTTASQNGIYVWTGAASAATRATDSDTAVKMTDSLLVTVDEGTLNADTVWSLSTPKPITLGTTSLRFGRLMPGYKNASRDPWSHGGVAICATMDRNDLTASIAQTAITAICSFHGGMVVPGGRLITNVNAFCTAAGSGAVTLFWWALVRASDRVVLQRTANSTTLPTIDAVHTRALQAAITLDYDTPCYVVLATQVATTSPSFAGQTQLATSNLSTPFLTGNSSTTPTSTPPTVGAVLGAPATGNVSRMHCWLT